MLKQAPLKWNKAINAHLHKSNFTPTKSDLCIYLHHSHHLAIMALYTNDCIIIAHQSKLKDFKQMASQSRTSAKLGCTSICSIKIQ